MFGNNYGCSNNCGNFGFGGFGGDSCWIIILLLIICNCGCNIDPCLLIIILLIVCGCGCGNNSCNKKC